MGELIGGLLAAFAMLCHLPTAIGLAGAMAGQHAQAQQARAMAEMHRRNTELERQPNG